MLPDPSSFTSPIEPFLRSSRADVCSQTAKPGVLAFRDFVLEEFGGSSSGICRACDKGNASDHHAGRAWDWHMSAKSSADRARVEQLLSWLLAPDADGNEAAMFRRLGMTYIIWDGMIWSTKMGNTWKPYNGPNPHTDHVHFSFSAEGADGMTSFWSGWKLPAEEECPDAVGGGGPTTRPKLPLHKAKGTSMRKPMALLAGVLGGYFAVRYYNSRPGRSGRRR